VRIEGLQGGILFGMLLIVFHLDDPNLRLQLIVEIFGLLASEWRERERERERRERGRGRDGEMERYQGFWNLLGLWRGAFMGGAPPCI